MDLDQALTSLANFRIKYFWIFVTAKCNLACRYCFYKFKDKKSSVSLDSIRLLSDLFPSLAQAEIVLSGGEPILEWDLTRRLILYLKQRFRNYILLQTNGTLLDESKIKFLKDHGIGLEFGIDGDLASMESTRQGLKRYFGKLAASVRLAQKAGMDVLATMTVPPLSARHTFKNFRYIADLGVKKIEVTPAAFERWRLQDVKIFKEQYRKIMVQAVRHDGLDLLSTEYDRPLSGPVIDLITLPDGTIMTNWALLSCPKRNRKKYVLFEIEKRRVTANENFVLTFLNQYLTFFKECHKPTYRDYSNFNARWIYEELRGKGFRPFYRNYEAAGDILKQMNQKVLMVRKEVAP